MYRSTTSEHVVSHKFTSPADNLLYNFAAFNYGCVLYLVGTDYLTDVSACTRKNKRNDSKCI